MQPWLYRFFCRRGRSLTKPSIITCRSLSTSNHHTLSVSLGLSSTRPRNDNAITTNGRYHEERAQRELARHVGDQVISSGTAAGVTKQTHKGKATHSPGALYASTTGSLSVQQKKHRPTKQVHGLKDGIAMRSASHWRWPYPKML